MFIWQKADHILSQILEVFHIRPGRGVPFSYHHVGPHSAIRLTIFVLPRFHECFLPRVQSIPLFLVVAISLMYQSVLVYISIHYLLNQIHLLFVFFAFTALPIHF